MDGVDVNTTPLPALVFFCSKCKSIVSDSTQFLFSVRSLNLLVVKGASGIRIDRAEGIDRPQQPDWRSVAVHCCNCATHLGRVYKQITGQMSLLKDLIALSVSTIGSYELGSCDTVIAGAPELEGRSLADFAAATGRASQQHAGSFIGRHQLAGAVSAQRVEELEAELVKVKALVLGHSERLKELERSAIFAATASRKRPNLQDLGHQQAAQLQSYMGGMPDFSSLGGPTPGLWGVGTPAGLPQPGMLGSPSVMTAHSPAATARAAVGYSPHMEQVCRSASAGQELTQMHVSGGLDSPHLHAVVAAQQQQQTHLQAQHAAAAAAAGRASFEDVLADQQAREYSGSL